MFECWVQPLPRAQEQLPQRPQGPACSLLGLAPAPAPSHEWGSCPGCQSWALALFFLMFLLCEMQRTRGDEDEERRSGEAGYAPGFLPHVRGRRGSWKCTQDDRSHAGAPGWGKQAGLA